MLRRLRIPDWKTHKKYGTRKEVSKKLDEDPFKILSHSEWRKLTHKPEVLAAMAFVFGDYRIFLEGLNHVLLDRLPKEQKLLLKLLEG